MNDCENKLVKISLKILNTETILAIFETKLNSVYDDNKAEDMSENKEGNIDNLYLFQGSIDIPFDGVNANTHSVSFIYTCTHISI
jgi:hypothetical protein